MNLTSLIANRYIYQNLFAEDGYARDGGFNVLRLDRHGGQIGAHKFSAHHRIFRASYIIFVGRFKFSLLCWQIELQNTLLAVKLAVGVFNATFN
jgi:hypothetical protein